MFVAEVCFLVDAVTMNLDFYFFFFWVQFPIDFVIYVKMKLVF